MTHKYLIVGNWKMNPSSIGEAKNIAGKIKRAAPQLKNTEAIMCPPFPFIIPCTPRKAVKNLSIGSQSVSSEESGSHTGEVSASMLKSIGVSYIIVGHSEQRAKGDTDELISKRIKNALDQGMTVILCVGEKVRDTEGSHLEGIKNQVKNSLANIPNKFASRIVLAYEPIWAIGASEPMKSEDIYEMSLFVKKALADVFTPDLGVKTTVLYGGSVNAENAAEIITVGKVDGLLVGRESVNSVGFVEMLKVVDGI